MHEYAKYNALWVIASVAAERLSLTAQAQASASNLLTTKSQPCAKNTIYMGPPPSSTWVTKLGAQGTALTNTTNS